MTRGGALVTGACGGIGHAVVARLAREGFRVTATDVHGEPPREAAAFVEADLRDCAGCDRAVAVAGEAPGGLAALVHAAGIARDAVTWKLAPADWEDVLAVNLTAAFALCRLAVPRMRERGGGTIVLISSINAERGKLGQSAYCASKAGLNAFARTLARETGRFGIRVNVVAPGMIETPMTAPLPADVVQRARDESCLGRLGAAEDVAGAVAFLASDDARHVTGQVLRVDGGQLA